MVVVGNPKVSGNFGDARHVEKVDKVYRVLLVGEVVEGQLSGEMFEEELSKYWRRIGGDTGDVLWFQFESGLNEFVRLV